MMIEKHVLEELYINRHLSMMEIANHLSVSPSNVSYWMSKQGIIRRSQRDATYFKRNPNGDPYEIKTAFEPRDILLLGLGLGIYWGEGNKVDRNTARLTNSDARLIRVYLKFLNEICGIQQSKIQFQLQLFRDIEEAKAIEYWMVQTGYPRENFRCIYYSPPQGKGTYRRKSKHGVITVLVCNKKFRNWIISRLIKLTDEKPIF